MVVYVFFFIFVVICCSLELLASLWSIFLCLRGCFTSLCSQFLLFELILCLLVVILNLLLVSRLQMFLDSIIIYHLFVVVCISLKLFHSFLDSFCISLSFCSQLVFLTSWYENEYQYIIHNTSHLMLTVISNRGPDILGLLDLYLFCNPAFGAQFKLVVNSDSR